MRPWMWAFILMTVMTFSVAYQLTNWSSWPSQTPVVADASSPPPPDQNSDQPLTHKDEARLPEAASSAVLKSDDLPVAQEQAPPKLAQEQAPPEIAPGTAASEWSNSIDTKQNDHAQSRLASLPGTVLKPDELPAAQEQVAPEETPNTGTIELGLPSETKQNLSWLGYYAYGELPPATKPAQTVLDALKSIPPGTPIEEIKRVADILGLNFTFMKAVAKIESGFNPKQRTGSYIGLFQLSNHEFELYGSGDIRDPRDNTVAAALKIMTEAILFETYTHKKPTLNDLYLIHQQGVDGAAEHFSHPGRLAWQSMCATSEGQEKGEKWCKRAIWGNTLPAIKKVWKNVDNVTSGAFIAMWQQRVSEFYARYSVSAAN
jgi:hypothetical protein